MNIKETFTVRKEWRDDLEKTKELHKEIEATAEKAEELTKAFAESEEMVALNKKLELLSRQANAYKNRFWASVSLDTEDFRKYSYDEETDLIVVSESEVGIPLEEK